MRRDKGSAAVAVCLPRGLHRLDVLGALEGTVDRVDVLEPRYNIATDRA